MAFSQSIGKAQTPAVCQFCEESTEIKWKCINCELFLCQLCSSKIHSKSKASMEHEIINLKDIETVDFANTMRQVDLKNMQCTIHSKEKCVIYCKDCSEPACLKCMIEVHQKREYKALDEVYDGLIGDIKDLEEQIGFNLQLYKKEKDQLQKVLSDGETNFHETRETILQTEKEMKEAVSKHAKELLQVLETKWKPSENMIKTELSSLTSIQDELETRRNNINQVLQSQQVAEIFSTSKTLEKSLPKYSAKTINHNKSKFIPTKMQGRIGSQMLGDLYTVPDFDLMDTYQSEVKTVSCLLLSSDNNAFIGSYQNEKLQNIKLENHNIKVEKEVKIPVYDMIWRNNGEILLSTTESDLKLYTKDGQLQTFQSFSPLQTLGVHLTRDNKIIVGLTDSFVMTATEDSIRKLVVMNQEGDIQHTIEHDSDNQRLFNHPRRINSFNDKIVVVDIINSAREGRVVMLDYGGQLHWSYNGCNTTNSDQANFYPRVVTITSTDMILVSDCYNHAIHILNPAGELFVCKDVKSLGIELPVCLDIDVNEF
ncbi:tripartite motif-containing protein 54-like [Mytilus trossulus]|uniref:tripartite motif-containing protein 54-like n=1 Tax=Mytilus trossulus TaxID=6551 RepID=UPI0030062A6E